MVRPPEAKKLAPAPPQGPAGADFQFQGCTTLFRDDFRFLFFPDVFRHIWQGMPLNLHNSAQKKFWRPFFWNFFAFYLVKWNPLGLTRRVKKNKLPHLIFQIQYQNLKRNFIYFFLYDL